MLSRSFFPNFGLGPFPKIAGKSPVIAMALTQMFIISCNIVDRRTGASRRHSMERMELMKLTPDKKGELPTANGGARPKIHKVQKSHSVAADILTPAQSRLEEVLYSIHFYMSHSMRFPTMLYV